MSMKSLLIVEGVEDQLFFQQLLRNHQINAEVKSHPSGKGNAIKNFENSMRIHDRIALVVDADYVEHGGGFSSTQKLINQKIQALEFNPLTAVSGAGSGLGSQKGKAKIGVWVMPNNHAEGYLEDFLKHIIPDENQRNWDYAIEQTGTALGSNIGFTAKSHHRSKSEMGAWLAWHDPPRMSFGKALSEGYFDRQHPSYLALVNWLKWVFS